MEDVCGLCDLGYTGLDWTFERKINNGQFCRVPPDRVLAMASWCVLFPLASVERLTATKSDYSPILLLNEMEAGNRRIALRKLFRYECMWEWHEQLKGVVQLAWQRQNGCTYSRRLMCEAKINGRIGDDLE